MHRGGRIQLLQKVGKKSRACLGEPILLNSFIDSVNDELSGLWPEVSRLTRKSPTNREVVNTMKANKNIADSQKESIQCDLDL